MEYHARQGSLLGTAQKYVAVVPENNPEAISLNFFLIFAIVYSFCVFRVKLCSLVEISFGSWTGVVFKYRVLYA